MYSLIIFLIIFIQSAVIGGSYLMENAEVFYNLAVYGSPFYSIMTLVRSGAAFLDSNPLYLIMAGYHFCKYGIFFLAQRYEGLNKTLGTAIFLEACYLLTNAYFLI